MESLGYVLIYLFNGKLPWSGITKEDFWERNEAVMKIKETYSINGLTIGLPEEF